MPLLTEPTVHPGRLSAQPMPVLAGDGLTLRPWVRADAPSLLAAYQDPAIQLWHARAMADVAEAERWIDSRHEHWVQEAAGDWAVESDGVVVGRTALHHLDLHEGGGEVGYWVLPAARGRRVAPRAVGLLVAWAFEDLGLHRLRLVHSTRNEASCKVALAAGFVPEGTLRESGKHVDGWHDMHLHARLAG
ncbi:MULTISPECIES: GNAT family N-acetyltransferase [Oerskovia]|uniref:GNAT family N-acetyltransferase n=1 Tax=Oerskovia rustica TaxID=2762237 RepID=A0ABR8RP11_9CELL|nr:GNAT family protein [Oerskovia rustica]MBD7949469.1 GNAT family N-acetyltransferase [Oerskovia rustica]